jgi:hypothetical protein
MSNNINRVVKTKAKKLPNTQSTLQRVQRPLMFQPSIARN